MIRRGYIVVWSEYILKESTLVLDMNYIGCLGILRNYLHSNNEIVTFLFKKIQSMYVSTKFVPFQRSIKQYFSNRNEDAFPAEQKCMRISAQFVEDMERGERKCQFSIKRSPIKC